MHVAVFKSCSSCGLGAAIRQAHLIRYLSLQASKLSCQVLVATDHIQAAGMKMPQLRQAFKTLLLNVSQVLLCSCIAFLQGSYLHRQPVHVRFGVGVTGGWPTECFAGPIVLHAPAGRVQDGRLHVYVLAVGLCFCRCTRDHLRWSMGVKHLKSSGTSPEGTALPTDAVKATAHASLVHMPVEVDTLSKDESVVELHET